MSRSLWVDPEQLRARAAGFQEIGDEVRQVMTRLQAALSAEGQWWGEDESGAAFAQSYEPDAEKAIAVIRDIADALNNFGGQVRGVADTVVAADQAAASQVENSPDTADFTRRPTGDLASADPAPNSIGARTAAGSGPESMAPQGPSEPSGGPTISMSPTRTGLGNHSPAAGGAGPDATPSANTGQSGGDGNGPQPGIEGGGTPGAPSVGRDEQRSSAGGRTPVGTAGGVADPPAARNSSSAGPVRAGAPGPGSQPRGAGARPPAISSGGDRRPPGTPWSGSAAPSGPPAGRPLPAAGPARRDGAKPAKEEKPRSGRPPGGRDDDRSRVTADPAARYRSGSPLMRLAQQLADRHGFAVTGFENADLDEGVVGEFLAATNDVLTRYPVIGVRGIEIGAAAAGEAIQIGSLERRWNAKESVLEWKVTFDAELAANPVALAQALRNKHRRTGTVPAADAPTVYEATTREFGRAFDRAGDRRARGCAQRALIAEYLGGDTAYRRAGLAQLVAGYRRWRDQLSSNSFDKGRFDAGAALEEAFADVMRVGDQADEPAKTLCRLLIDTAKTVSSASGPVHKQ